MTDWEKPALMHESKAGRYVSHRLRVETTALKTVRSDGIVSTLYAA